MNNYYNSWFKVDTNQVVENFHKVDEYIGENTKIIPVVKGNCYGYGMIPMAKLYESRCGVELLAVAAIWEAVELRNAGLACGIFVMGGIPRQHLSAAFDYDLQIPLFDEGTAKELERIGKEKGKKINVHIKLETGMNRLGVRPGETLQTLLDLVKSMDYIEVIGAYSHFATSTSAYYDPFAVVQFERYKKGVEQIKASGDFDLKYTHCCNSAAIAWFKEAREYCTHVRSCSSILGHMAMEDGREPIGVVEPLEIGAYITNIHDVEAGESIGYSRSFTADKPMTVATLSIGFADGFYPKWMRGGGPLLINGHRAKFIGCCMDQSSCDVTGIPCEIGDKVILIGKSGDERITTWDMEQFCGNTFEYLYGTIGPRVERIYE